MRRHARRGATLDEIEAAYRRDLQKLRGVAFAILRDRELALDAVQESFASAVRHRKSFRGDGSLDAWLWRIVVNTAQRQSGTAYVELEPTQGIDASTNGAASDVEERVRSAIAVLPDRQRLILFLRYYADLDYDRIAEVVDISSGTVAATLNAARASVRAALKEVRH
jgi:RNA polymerase sigma-70 factor, ECF subfamily